jgi:CHASE3 domain sensor protein
MPPTADLETRELVDQHERIIMGYYDKLTNKAVPGILKTSEETNHLVRKLVNQQSQALTWLVRIVITAGLGGLLDRLGLITPAIQMLKGH